MNEIDPIRVSAPGKLLLLGEYSVAFGGLGLAMAVDRRVELRPAPTERIDRENLVDFCRDFAAQRLGVATSGPAWRADSSRLYEGEVKLGLGSSAAVAAAAVSSLLVELGHEIDSASERGRLWRLTLDAHRAIQGGSGSGIDIAASVFGGVVGLRAGVSPQEVEACGLPRDLRLVPVWTGEAASTPALLRAVRTFAQSSPGQFDVLMGEMREVVEPFFVEDPCSAGAWIAAARRYGDLMARLGEAAGAGIVTPRIQQLIALAGDLGGAAKPSGAGGGDVVLGFFSDEGAAAKFGVAAPGADAVPLDLAFEPVGVRAASGPDGRSA